MTSREMLERIEVLERDLAEATREIGDLGFRVFQLEEANRARSMGDGGGHQLPARFGADDWIRHGLEGSR